MTERESDQWIQESSDKHRQSVEPSSGQKIAHLVHDGSRYLKQAHTASKHERKVLKQQAPEGKTSPSKDKPTVPPSDKVKDPLQSGDKDKPENKSTETKESDVRKPQENEKRQKETVTPQRKKEAIEKKELSDKPSERPKASNDTIKDPHLQKEGIEKGHYYRNAVIKTIGKQGVRAVVDHEVFEETAVRDVQQVARNVNATKEGIQTSHRVIKATTKGTMKTAKGLHFSWTHRRQFFQQAQARVVQTVRWAKAVFQNPLILVKSLSIPTLVILVSTIVVVVVASVTSITSSFTLKATDNSVTKTWEALTKLDAEQTVDLRKGKGSLLINDATTLRDQVMIITPADDIIGYLDTLYGGFELSGHYTKDKQSGEEVLNAFYQQLYQSKEKDDETLLTIHSLEDIVAKDKEHVDQLEAMKEVGQYTSLIEFTPLVKGQETLLVAKRYGYYAKEKKTKFSDTLTVQVEKGAVLQAPLEGDLTLKDETTVIIEQNKKKLTLTGISPTVKDGQQVKAGQKIGTAKDDKVTVGYKKNKHRVNPAFYFPYVTYLESTQFGFSGGSASFDEAVFKMVIQSRCNAFKDKADKIIIEAKKAGVNPIIFAAIMIHESAWGTSEAIRTHNNPSGQMNASGLIHYDTLDKGIEATGRTLHNLIVERQLHTVEALGSVYCPVGADNDPLGLNKNWVPAIKNFMETLGGSKSMSLLWGGASGKAGKVLEFAESLYGKGVIYSMGSNRGNFPYHDCSSFVTTALKSAGLNVSIGSTDYLYTLEGTLLESISRSEVKPGDLFVWGNKGGSGGELGHTGIFLDDGGKTIIHCTPSTNQNGNIVKTPFEGYYGSPSLAPVYFYRIK